MGCWCGYCDALVDLAGHRCWLRTGARSSFELRDLVADDWQETGLSVRDACDLRLRQVLKPGDASYVLLSDSKLDTRTITEPGEAGIQSFGIRKTQARKGLIAVVTQLSATQGRFKDD